MFLIFFYYVSILILFLLFFCILSESTPCTYKNISIYHTWLFCVFVYKYCVSLMMYANINMLSVSCGYESEVLFKSVCKTIIILLLEVFFSSFLLLIKDKYMFKNFNIFINIALCCPLISKEGNWYTTSVYSVWCWQLLKKHKSKSKDGQQPIIKINTLPFPL